MKSIVNRYKNSGFSLIELTIVLGLIGVVGFGATHFLGLMTKTEKKLDNSLEMQEYQRYLKQAFSKKDVCEQMIPESIDSKETNLEKVSYVTKDGATRVIVKKGQLNPSSKIHITKISFELGDFDELKKFAANDIYNGVNTLSISYNVCQKASNDCSTGSTTTYTKEFTIPISGVVTPSKTLSNVDCDVKFTEFVERAVVASAEGFGLIKYVNPHTGAFEGNYGLPVYVHDECTGKTGKFLADCEQSKKKFIPEPTAVDVLSKAFCDINTETMFDIAKASINTNLSNDDKFLMYTQFCPEIKSANCIWANKTVEPGKFESVTEAFSKKVFHVDNMTSLFNKYDDRFKNSSVAQNQSVKLHKDRGFLRETGYGEALSSSNDLGKAALLGGFGAFSAFSFLDACPKYEIKTQFQCTDSQMRYSSSQIRDSKFSWVPSGSKCGTNSWCWKILGKKMCITIPRGPCCYWGDWQQ